MIAQHRLVVTRDCSELRGGTDRNPCLDDPRRRKGLYFRGLISLGRQTREPDALRPLVDRIVRRSAQPAVALCRVATWQLGQDPSLGEAIRDVRLV